MVKRKDPNYQKDRKELKGRKELKNLQRQPSARFELPQRFALGRPGQQNQNNQIHLMCIVATITCSAILVTLFYPFIPQVVKLFAIPVIMIGSYFVATRVVSPLIQNQLSDRLDRNGFPMDKEFTRDPEWSRIGKYLTEFRRVLVLIFAAVVTSIMLQVTPPILGMFAMILIVVAAVSIFLSTLLKLLKDAADAVRNGTDIEEIRTIYYLNKKYDLEHRLTSLIETVREDLRHVPSTPLLGSFIVVALFIAGILFSLLH